MNITQEGEFAGKQISVILSASNPGGFSVIPSQDARSQSLFVGFDGPVTFNGKELRLEITSNSVKVKVVSDKVHGKNTLTVATPKGEGRTVDILPTTIPEWDFGPIPNVLIDDFPLDIDLPMEPLAPSKPRVQHNKLESRYANVFVTSKSATEIHGLSVGRIERSGYISHSTLPGVKIDYFKKNEGMFFDVMMSSKGDERLKDSIRRAVHKMDCRTIIITVDEAHTAAGEKHQLGLVLKEFDFSSKNGGMITVDGIKVSLKIVLVTATPTQKFSHNLGRLPTLHVRAEPGDTYWGVEHLLKSARMVHVKKDISAKNLAELVKSHSGYKPQGIIVLRLPSNKRNGKFVSDLKCELGGEHLVRSFDSNNQNLTEFNKFISSSIEPLGRGAIAVLKDGFSAGFTFDRTDRIAAWIDLHYNDFEALVQSGGRNFGHGKGGDSYPIIANRDRFEAYERCIIDYRAGQMPSLNVGHTSEKREASKLKFECFGDPVYKIGTKAEFDADFAKRGDMWPPKLVESPMNSDSTNHIYRWTQDNIADMLLRPTKVPRLRGYDISVPNAEKGERLTREMCTGWFTTDEAGNVVPKDEINAEAYFSSLQKLRTQHEKSLTEGKNILWLSTETKIISKFDAKNQDTGKPQNIGGGTKEKNHDDVNDASLDDCLQNTFFNAAVPSSMMELVEHMRDKINALYIQSAEGSSKAPEHIYKDAILPAAQLLYSVWALEEPTIVLTSQMQAGKTSIIILFMHRIPYLSEYTLQNG